MEVIKCNKYIWEDLRVFPKSYYVYCSQRKCKTNIINHVIFALIVCAIIGSIGSYVYKSSDILSFFIILATFHGLYWLISYHLENQKKEEIPTSTLLKEAFEPSIPDGILEEVIGSNFTEPTAKNPFMNVLIDEIKYNPKRAPAASVLDPSVCTSLNDFFKTQFVNDETDVFGKTQSQRQFITMPGTGGTTSVGTPGQIILYVLSAYLTRTSKLNLIKYNM